MRYAVVIEDAGGNSSAYVPDLPGCVATGATVVESEQAIREAIEFPLEGIERGRYADFSAINAGRLCGSCSLTSQATSPTQDRFALCTFRD
jgi:predicted RNase H-like HicB family nuclease